MDWLKRQRTKLLLLSGGIDSFMMTKVAVLDADPTWDVLFAHRVFDNKTHPLKKMAEEFVFTQHIDALREFANGLNKTLNCCGPRNYAEVPDVYGAPIRTQGVILASALAFHGAGCAFDEVHIGHLKGEDDGDNQLANVLTNTMSYMHNTQVTVHFPINHVTKQRMLEVAYEYAPREALGSWFCEKPIQDGYRIAICRHCKPCMVRHEAMNGLIRYYQVAENYKPELAIVEIHYNFLFKRILNNEARKLLKGTVYLKKFFSVYQKHNDGGTEQPK